MLVLTINKIVQEPRSNMEYKFDLDTHVYIPKLNTLERYAETKKRLVKNENLTLVKGHHANNHGNIFKTVKKFLNRWKITISKNRVFFYSINSAD